MEGKHQDIFRSSEDTDISLRHLYPEMQQNQGPANPAWDPSRYVPYPSQEELNSGQRIIYPIPRPSNRSLLTDTNWKSWTMVVVSFCACFCTMGLGNSFGVFQSYYEGNILDSYSPSAISWIGTTQGFLLSVVSFFSGPLYDRGYVRPLFYVGSVLNVVGILGTSFATTYATIFLSFGIALGLGCGILYVPAIALVSSYFSKKDIPVPTAIAMSGSSIGGILYPILFRQLVTQVGFSWACRIFASINGGLLLAACLLVRSKKSEETREANADNQSQNFRLRSVFDWKLCLFGICALMMNVGIDVPFYFIPTFVHDQLKLSPGVGDALLAGLNASSLFGRLFLNWLSQSSSPLIIWQFTILITGVLLFWWYTISNLAGVIEFVICYGFVDGGLISLITPCVHELYPDPGMFGARLGVVEGFQGVGFLVGPPIAGALMDSPAGYFGVSLFNGTLYFILFILVGAFFTRKHFLKRSSKDDDPSAQALLQPNEQRVQEVQQIQQNEEEPVARRRSV